MDLGLRDQVAIVGGSSRGIGRAIAMALVREGASVTICGRTESDLRHTELELAQIASQQHVFAVPADLSVARDVRRVVRDTMNRFNRVGILVTHMAYGPMGRPSEFTDETIMAAMEQNFLSTVRLAREVIPFMKQQHWGRIIHLSPFHVKQPTDHMVLSASSQLALAGYSKMLATELAPFHITVNNVICGPIETKYLEVYMAIRAEENGCTPADVAKETLGAIPMERFGKPEEVADIVAYLASDLAGYVTGTSLVIDGGMLRSFA